MRRSNKLALKIAIATICANALVIYGGGGSFCNSNKCVEFV